MRYHCATPARPHCSSFAYGCQARDATAGHAQRRWGGAPRPTPTGDDVAHALGDARLPVARARGLCYNSAARERAGVAQWQSSCFVNSRPSVRPRPPAPQNLAFQSGGRDRSISPFAFPGSEGARSGRMTCSFRTLASIELVARTHGRERELARRNHLTVASAARAASGARPRGRWRPGQPSP